MPGACLSCKPLKYANSGIPDGVVSPFPYSSCGDPLSVQLVAFNISAMSGTRACDGLRCQILMPCYVMLMLSCV